MNDETMQEVTPKQREEIAERVLGKGMASQVDILETIVHDPKVFGDPEELAHLTLPPVVWPQRKVQVTFTHGNYDGSFFSVLMRDAMQEYIRSDQAGSNETYLATNGVIMEFEAAPQLPEVKA